MTGTHQTCLRALGSYSGWPGTRGKEKPVNKECRPSTNNHKGRNIVYVFNCGIAIRIKRQDALNSHSLSGQAYRLPEGNLKFLLFSVQTLPSQELQYIIKYGHGLPRDVGKKSLHP